MKHKEPQLGSSKDQRMRLQLAQEAARIIAEEGLKDFHAAKQKAAIRLHAPHTHNLPRNDEVKQALNEYLRLFKSESQPTHLHKLREQSRKAMAFFQRFEPRLVGPVLDGSAGEFSDIDLHLFADTPEEVSIFLFNNHIQFELTEQFVSMPDGSAHEQPAFQIMRDNILIELTVFDRSGLRHAPRCPVSGKPMERANLENLEALLQQA